MPKSAERKRRESTTRRRISPGLVHQTVSVLVKQRRDTLLATHGLKPTISWSISHPRSCETTGATAERPALDQALRPGVWRRAFLIAAYEVFEDEYVRVADHRRTHDGPEADALLNAIPDLILTENLHGVDLSEQSVEIAQLALWIRSARRGKTRPTFRATYPGQQPGQRRSAALVRLERGVPGRLSARGERGSIAWSEIRRGKR